MSSRKMRVAILSASEVCYHARLVKAADFLFSKGCEVHIYNPVTGFAPEDVYDDFKRKRGGWHFHESDISKRKPSSKIKWLVVSLVQRMVQFFWSALKLSVGSNYLFAKGWIFSGLMSDRNNFDVVVVNLIDMLPIAAEWKKHSNAQLVYDSQEYFTGQFSDKPIWQKRWVENMEERFIRNADLVVSTTQILGEKLKEKYNLNSDPVRVRNMPSRNQQIQSKPETGIHDPVRLVWHGMAVYYGNRRGLQVIVEALRYCKSNVELYIQGNPVPTELDKIRSDAQKWSIEEKIHFVPAALPDEIVRAIGDYDIGVSGEIPVEENQLYTSSNKLFEYINAGLAVMGPNVPGIAETLNMYDVGLLYEPGNPQDLASKIDKVISSGELPGFKENAATVSENELFWEADYQAVWEHLEVSRA